MPKNRETPHLGHKLAEAIKQKGVTQAAVAKHFKVSAPTVSGDWIKRGTIDKKHYPELVSYFGFPYEWWFEDTPSSLSLAFYEQKGAYSTSLGNEEEAILKLMGKLDRESRAALLKIASMLPVDEKKIGGRRIGGERRQRENTVKQERRRIFGTSKGGK